MYRHKSFTLDGHLSLPAKTLVSSFWDAWAPRNTVTFGRSIISGSGVVVALSVEVSSALTSEVNAGYELPIRIESVSSDKISTSVESLELWEIENVADESVFKLVEDSKLDTVDEIKSDELVLSWILSDVGEVVKDLSKTSRLILLAVASGVDGSSAVDIVAKF